MKKLATIVALILLFSMLLCSCNNIKTPPEESGTPSATPKESDNETEFQNPTETPDLEGEETPKESDNETVSTNPPEQKFVIDPLGYVAPPDTGYEIPLYLNSLEEYEAFINTTELPDSFVRYERIKSFGEFLLFEYYRSADNYSEYSYWLKDETGSEMHLYVSDAAYYTGATETLSTNVVDINDMRTLSAKKNGTFAIDGVSYMYYKGNLVKIIWVENGTYFYLSQSLSTYPSSQSSTVGKLMNANNAADVLGQMFEIDTTQQKYHVDFNLSIKYVKSWRYCHIGYTSTDDLKNSLDDKELLCSALANRKVPDNMIEPFETFLETYQPQDAIFPYWFDKPMELREENPKIAIYPCESYDLTWIAYFSSYEEIPEWKESFVKVAYIPEGILEGKNDLTVAEVLKELSSDSVGVDNWGPYHKNVYNTNLKLQDREVTALIIEYNYKAYHLETMIFVYDNLLVVISIDLDLWDISWFQYFGFAPLQ